MSTESGSKCFITNRSQTNGKHLCGGNILCVMCLEMAPIYCFWISYLQLSRDTWSTWSDWNCAYKDVKITLQKVKQRKTSYLVCVPASKWKHKEYHNLLKLVSCIIADCFLRGIVHPTTCVAVSSGPWFQRTRSVTTFPCTHNWATSLKLP